jgi:ACS family hexuronate transporter-like MFS transporter
MLEELIKLEKRQFASPVKGRTWAGRNYQQARWLIAIWLMLSTILNLLDRQTLSILAPFLCDQLQISVRGYSNIVAAFMVTYGVMYALGGRFVDHVGERFGMAVCILWWSLWTMLTAVAVGPWSLGAIRFMLGIGESGNYPAALRAVTRWFPNDELGLPVALFSSGSALGNVLAAPVVAFLTLRFGWRAAFVLPGVLGLLWLAGWLALYHMPEDDACVTWGELRRLRSAEGECGNHAGIPSWRSLVKNQGVRALVLARFLSDPVSYFYIFWIPEYLKHARGFSLAQIGMYGWIPFVGGAVGSVVGGRISDLLIRRGWNPLRARKLLLYLSAAVAPAGVFISRVHSAAAAIALMSVMSFVVYCWFINTAAMIPDVASARASGSVLGIIGSAGSLGGVLFTLLTGFLVSHYASYAPVFAIVGSLHVCSAVILWVFMRDGGQHPAEARAA